MRLKGHATFRPLGKKAAFKVKFPKANRLLGLKSMTLNNIVQDESMIHETLGYEILRAADIPAPRTGFAYVRVNGKRYGLYLGLRDLRRHLDEAPVRLDTRAPLDNDDYGVDVVSGAASAYQVEEGDEDDLQRPRGPDRRHQRHRRRLVRRDGCHCRPRRDDAHVGRRAVHRPLGRLQRAGPAFYQPNNYYLHSDDGGRFSMLPSGLDQTFVDGDQFPGAGDGLLAVNCRADSSCLAAFRDRLGEVAAAADAMHVGARASTRSPPPSPAGVPCADLERATDPKWQTAVTGTRAFVRDRRDAVASYRGTAQPARDSLLDSTAPPALSGAGCRSTRRRR